MTFLRSVIALLAAAVILFSCKKEYSIEDGDLPNVIEESWEFTEAGTLRSGPMDSAHIQKVGTVQTLSLVGSSDELQGELFMQIVGETIAIGTYTSPLVFFQYAENGSVVFQSSPSDAGAFSIVINELDSQYIAGTFSGTVLDAQGNSHTISDGKFRSEIGSSEQEPEPVPSGQLTVWAKQFCTDGSNIEVRVDGQSMFIQDAILNEPACGATGTAVFSLLYGNYTLEAICGADTVRYEVTIGSDCTLLEVDLQNPPELDYLPLVEGSFWEYTDLNDAGNIHRITAEGGETFEGRMYTRFVSTAGDTFYYRKSQGVYYEYRTLNFQEYVEDPPAIEMVILYEDYQTGQSWETPGETIVLSGVTVRVKFVSTIVRRDFSETYNGTLHSDLIDVKTEIFFSSDGGNTYQSSGSSYNTVFSKGNGIVYYYDIDRDIEWGASWVSINQ